MLTNERREELTPERIVDLRKLDVSFHWTQGSMGRLATPVERAAFDLIDSLRAKLERQEELLRLADEMAKDARKFRAFIPEVLLLEAEEFQSARRAEGEKA